MRFEKLFTAQDVPTYVIAEIGGNFFTYDEAVALIDAAKASGADCVKLQTYRAETITSKKAMFDMENTGKISQYDYFKRFEISKELHKKVFAYAAQQGLDYFSTPSHPTDVDMLESLGVAAHKVGADDATNIPFLKYIAKTGKPVFLSTGMCTLDEIKESVAAILEEDNKRIVIFHTVSGYPTKPKFVNLNVIKTFLKEFPEFPIGFSDHSITTMASIAAAIYGAKVIERHFTLDKNADGPDHMLSSTPDELKTIVDSIRFFEKMKGSAVKQPFGPEVQNRANNRKSLVSTKDIKKGQVFTKENIDCKRPGYGIAPKFYSEILGKTAARDIESENVLSFDDVAH